MTDPAAIDVPSPCIDVCRLDEASGLCRGCYRSLDEIAAWSRLDARAKRAVLSELPLRRLAGESSTAAASDRSQT